MTEPTTSPADQEGGRPIGRLITLALLAVFVGFFTGGALVLTAEVFGPSSEEAGRVLERIDNSRTTTRCDVNRIPGRDRCRTVNIPSGVVAGELENGDSWAVVDRQAYDNAPSPGSDVTVTVSSLTGRVTGIDSGSRLDDQWSLGGSLTFIVVAIFGAIMLAVAVGLLLAGDRSWLAPRSLPRGSGAIAGLGGLAVGLVGAWWMLFVAPGQYDSPTSAELYGGAGLVADPYGFVGTAEEAEDDGRIVHIVDGTAANFDLRVLTDDEVGEIRDAVPEGVTPVYVVVDGLLRAPLALIARSVDSTGELVDAAPCASATLEYPIAISVDSDIVGAVFCLAERPADDTIYVSTKILDPSVRGTPVRLEPAE
ncbi:MAG: hypothetical protein KDB21_09505 [Acidimicrobiales bacterium]|nr:hypothetical protein [Acidimicrobiales bacterium]